MFKIERIDHIALTVKDPERSAAWYQDVLGLERSYEDVWPQPPVVCAGQACIFLFAADKDNPLPIADVRNTIAMRHFAFTVNRASFEQAQAEFRRRGIEFEFEDHQITHSIYIYDLDGYRVELTTDEL